MKLERGVVKVGLEIEVPAWTNGRTYQRVASDLIDAGYMLGPKEIWQEFHTYGCRCSNGGCEKVRSGTVYVPPLVSLTYDASLPNTGAEFVMSPILLIEGGIEDMRSIWDTVVKDAVWTLDGKNRHGGPVSPSVHEHVSVTRSNSSRIDNMKNKQLEGDVLQALTLFSPEFIAIASSAGKVRGLSYRQPTRQADGTDNGHHGLVQIRHAAKDYLYIEWRMFEATYDNWDYILGGTYLVASLTRALTDPSVRSAFMSVGYSRPFFDDEMWDAIRRDDTRAVLAMVDDRRLEFLRDIALNDLADDGEGKAAVDELFNRMAK